MFKTLASLMEIRKRSVSRPSLRALNFHILWLVRTTIQMLTVAQSVEDAPSLEATRISLKSGQRSSAVLMTVATSSSKRSASCRD